MFEAQKQAIAEARERYHAIVETAPAPQVRAASAAVKEAQAALAAAIVEGAAPCSGPSCNGATPHGMEQEYSVKNTIKYGYEIGCTLCTDHRAFGATHTECLEAWNAQQYINPAKAQAHVDEVEARRAEEEAAAAEAAALAASEQSAK
jgi:hypothetical protein